MTPSCKNAVFNYRTISNRYQRQFLMCALRLVRMYMWFCWMADQYWFRRHEAIIWTNVDPVLRSHQGSMSQFPARFINICAAADLSGVRYVITMITCVLNTPWRIVISWALRIVFVMTRTHCIHRNHGLPTSLSLIHQQIETAITHITCCAIRLWDTRLEPVRWLWSLGISSQYTDTLHLVFHMLGVLLKNIKCRSLRVSK